MKNPHRESVGAGKTQRAADNVILADSNCPNASPCSRWSADDGGAYCRLCWRDFTDPRPLQVVEGRA